VLKAVTKRPRPLTVIHRTRSSGSSFPSNHVDMSVACYCGIALLSNRASAGNKSVASPAETGMDERKSVNAQVDEEANSSDSVVDSRQRSDEQGGRPAKKRGKRRTLLPAILLCFLIGYSRVYLGSHRASDVVGGGAVAAILLAICLRMRAALEARNSSHNVAAGIS
jgi:membrane-associated phospholipid phosphatase